MLNLRDYNERELAKELKIVEKNFETYKKKAINKIAGQRYRDGDSLLKSGYTQLKWRIYDEQERKAYNKKKFLENFKKDIDK